MDSRLSLVMVLIAIGIYFYPWRESEGDSNSPREFLPASIASVSSFVTEVGNEEDEDRREKGIGEDEEEGAEESGLFTRRQLSRCKGEEPEDRLYIAIFGKVYDVAKGRQYYKPGGPYHIFAGRDASRSFITGDFSDEGLSDDISDFSKNQLIGLKDWVQVYEENYIYKGKLIGRYYDEKGEPTEYLLKIEEELVAAEVNKHAEMKDKERYPPCNAEWTPEKGSRLWCSKKSGGIARDWVGVPRKYYRRGSTEVRCACVNLDTLSGDEGNFKTYRDCDGLSSSCSVKEEAQDP